MGAHPDDRVRCGATLAKWADADAQVHLCICTDGSKGTWDTEADTHALIDTRQREQRAAGSVLGAAAVEFLGYIDGELDHGAVAQTALAGVIRRTRPDVVLGHDPWAAARIHPDHRHAGLLTLDAIVAARDPHFFPEQLRDGRITSHRPSLVLLFESERPDHVERVEQWMDRVEALLRHRSRGARPWGSTIGPKNNAAFVRRVHDEAQARSRRRAARRSIPHDRARVGPARKGPGCARSPRLAVLAQRLAVRFRAVRFVARLAEAFFAALRRAALQRWPSLPCGLAARGLALGDRCRFFFAALQRVALRFAGALLADFLVVRLRVVFFAVDFCAALRFAGAFLAALRLAGAFLFVAFLAGGTVTTFLESSHSGEVRTSRCSLGARVCPTPYSATTLAPGP